MEKRGRCRCGSVLVFHPTSQGYKTRCPACHAAYDLCRAGRSLDGDTTHLDPLPLVEDGGEVRIAVMAAR